LVWLLRYCPKCGRYTLNQEKCPVCGGEVRIPHPAKFSIDDRYQNYRLRLMRLQKKVEEEKEKAEP
jgi:H/ACA ribonucleoprotein complex subunit 3